MAKREAQARSIEPTEGMPATLSSATEEHAQALKQQLLETTERAAQTLIGQTRAEGERRIEMAGRQAQAIAETVSAVEQAEQELAQRARAFADASKALRAELNSFAAILSEGEARLMPQSSDEPDLRLVESPPAPETREAPTSFGQILISNETEEVDEPGEDEGNDDNRPENEFDEDDDEEDPAGEVDDESKGDDEEDDDEPPTPDQIAQFFREHEEAELARQVRAEREAEGKPGLGDRLRHFFSAPVEFDDPDAPEVIEEPRAEPAPKRDRNPKRDRLYTDVGGAVIGLGGAAALINFVLLK